MSPLPRLAELALEALELIHKATKLGGDTGLAAIRGLTWAFAEAQQGNVSVNEIETEIAKLRASLETDVAAQNASIDDRLADKFGVKDD